MNTNSNVYTIVYTTILVMVVAALLAFVSQSLKPMQEANEKAETISQILTAAGFGEKEHWQEIGNAATIKFFEQNIEGSAAIASTSDLKAFNYQIKDGKKADLPVYRFNNGVTVLAIYGAGLWGPIWGYVALEPDMKTVKGAYFDHASETPGLGGKINEDPAFRAQFESEILNFEASQPISVVKNAAPKGNGQIDAISGATMTCKGLHAALGTWLNAYVENLNMGGTVNE